MKILNKRYIIYGIVTLGIGLLVLNTYSTNKNLMKMRIAGVNHIKNTILHSIENINYYNGDLYILLEYYLDSAIIEDYKIKNIILDFNTIQENKNEVKFVINKYADKNLVVKKSKSDANNIYILEFLKDVEVFTKKV
ncbi:MAG: hypothetical protein ACRC41_18510 [Sarcina sp.]